MCTECLLLLWIHTDWFNEKKTSVRILLIFCKSEKVELYLFCSNIFCLLSYAAWRGAHIFCCLYSQQERRFMCLGVTSSLNEDRINRDLNATKPSGLTLLLLPNRSLPSPASQYFLWPKPIQLQKKNAHSCNTAFPSLQSFHIITFP